MAIALDSSLMSDYKEGGAETSTTSFTNTAGTFLVVVARCWHCSGTQQTCTGVTYNSVAMTKAVEIQHDIGGGCQTSNSIWYLNSPATGTNNCVVTYDNIVYGGITTTLRSFTGVKSTSPLDAQGSSNCNCVAITSSLTASAAGDVLIMSISTSSTRSPNSGQTADDGSGGGYKLGLSSGSNNDNWTLDSGCTTDDYAHAIFLQETATAPNLGTWFRGMPCPDRTIGVVSV